MSFTAALRWVRQSSVFTSRALLWSVLGAALVCAFFILALRYWFLPNIETYRDDIAAAVSRAANAHITIGRISGEWQGIRPYLKLEDVAVYDQAGALALELKRVDSTLAWRSLASLRLHFHALDIYGPALEVRRDTSGVFSVAGIAVEADRAQSGFTDWLLEQPDVEVHDATVVWNDELRQAPRLELSGVDVQLLNRGSRHRFGLRATPPASLAAPIDLRGDVRGKSLAVLSEWNGRLFLQLDYVDLGAWSPWLDIAAEITNGSGALRSWLTFDQHALSELVADVRLASVRARLRQDFPRIELEKLAGRLAWKRVPSGYEFSGVKLGLTGGGAVLQPADFRVRVTTDRTGVQQGELNANAFALEPLVMLADRLPLGDELRSELVALSPRGSVHDLTVRWNGEWPQPATYSARGRFEALAINRRGKLPGFSGLSGHIDGTEQGGTLHVSGQRASLDMPRVFARVLELDTLTAQVAWAWAAERLELKLSNVSFANSDAVGSLFGSYRSAAAGPGDIDLTGSLSRANAQNASRYIPITILKKTRPWFERAFVAGHSSDVRFRVKGPLDAFPFPQEKHGIFHAVAKVRGGVLDYAERWPPIENIEGDFQFRGSRMDFFAQQATISGVKLSNVRGDIPDMTAQDEILSVHGQAEGRTSQFLSFIEKSPVAAMIDHFTDGMQAQGSGRLALKLMLPLTQLGASKVAGSYQFAGNRVVFERDLPPLEQAQGRIDFTEATVRTPGVTGLFLGGPVAISATTQRDSTLRATLQGRVNADNVRKAGGPAWMRHLRGSTEWRGVLTLRKKTPELVIESNLQGIASHLPAPFAKTAAESVPMRLERRASGSQHDRISFAYGALVKAELARRSDGSKTIVERGVVQLGGAVPGTLDRAGVWIRGTLPRLDFDEWLAFSRRGDGNGESAVVNALAGADVKLDRVAFFGRDFNDLALTLSSEPAATQLTFGGPEIEGGATWRGGGKGRLTARLAKLTLPAADPLAIRQPARGPAEKLQDLPALDVIVERFQHGQKQLGRLELSAIHQGRDWRIERLKVSNPDSVITAEGVWRGWQTEPRTELDVRMDVREVGKTLTRWTYPAGIRRGTAKIEGRLAWAGGPHDFDYPTLSGHLVVEAANGQFVKLEPGLAKLLGILSLQALPRRISLDFRDVFSEGFAFDTIIGALKIDHGLVTTENFRLRGPSARVVMGGRVDLARETQKLRVRVTPHLSDSVSLAGALIGGPVAGVATFLAQKILKDPIEELVSFEYDVTGGWSAPQVTKVARAPLTPVEDSP